jgi:hypothetical protein
MPIALTCICGARLEIDDKFAGQTIACPDCQHPLEARPAPQIVRRTSGWALASLILALVGAFTIIGTVAAVLVGAIALLQIAHKSDRLAGRGYAIAGMVIGVIMTASTVFAISSIELFGLTALVSEANWAGKLDFGGPLEVVRDQEGFAITRPSARWGVHRPPPSRAWGDLNHSVWDDLLLVLPADDAVVLCFAAPVSRDDGIAQCRDRFERDFRDMDRVGLFNKVGRGLARGPSLIALNSTKWPPKQGNVEMVEMQIDKRVAGEDKSFLARVAKLEGDDRMYVVIAGVRRSRYHRLEGQFREALDSFRLLSRNLAPDR